MQVNCRSSSLGLMGWWQLMSVNNVDILGGDKYSLSGYVELGSMFHVCVPQIVMEGFNVAQLLVKLIWRIFC